jgi:hypothetical protein
VARLSLAARSARVRCACTADRGVVRDVITGGARAGGSGVHGGAPPPVLLAVLGVAALVAVTFLAFFGAFAGGSDNVDAASRR